MKKIVVLVSVVLLIVSIGGGVLAEEGKGEYEYFTQAKNITNINTQLPAQKGLTKKSEEGVKSVGLYEEKTRAPKTHVKFHTEIKVKGNSLTINYGVEPNMNAMSSRIPLSQQLLQEAADNHTYLVFPEELSVAKITQFIYAINNTTEKGSDAQSLFSGGHKTLQAFNEIQCCA